MTARRVTATSRTRIGRPPRIDRDAIARAVIEIGFEDVTMKLAADRLGVSVPGLYHHVRGKDDLIALAAGYRLAATQMPEYTGQRWRGWLLEWAHHTRRGLAASPEMFQHFLTGEIDDHRYFDALQRVLEPLLALGFSLRQATDAWDAVSAIAVGSAAADLREATLRAAGRPWMARAHSEIATRSAGELGVVRALLGEPETDGDEMFDRRLVLVLDAIAATLPRAIAKA